MDKIVFYYAAIHWAESGDTTGTIRMSFYRVK